MSHLQFEPVEQPVAEPIMREILQRLQFLEQVGLDYLTLDRSTDTLSGGELQRVRLATGIGSGLIGICYVLDEPSIGLHSRDNPFRCQVLQSYEGGSAHIQREDIHVSTSACPSSYSWVGDLSS